MVTPSRQFGDKGENAAVEFLRQKGVRILECNFLVPQGEIDIVAQEKDELVFVEVKTRKNNDDEVALEAITPEKIAKLEAAIEAYFEQKDLESDEKPWRIDVITVCFAKNIPHCTHYPDILS